MSMGEPPLTSPFLWADETRAQSFHCPRFPGRQGKLLRRGRRADSHGRIWSERVRAAATDVAALLAIATRVFVYTRRTSQTAKMMRAELKDYESSYGLRGSRRAAGAAKGLRRLCGWQATERRRVRLPWVAWGFCLRLCQRALSRPTSVSTNAAFKHIAARFRGSGRGCGAAAS